MYFVKGIDLEGRRVGGKEGEGEEC